MNLEEIINFVKAREGKFIGFFPVSFPVYVVHIAYDSVDTDPFFPIYKALLKYTEMDPKHSQLPYFSRLIGFDLDMLTRCIYDLKEDGMIRWHIDQYRVSDDARRKYFISGNRPMVRVTGSFLVDGKSLELLPEVVYNNRRTLSFWDTNVATHKPVDIAMSSAPAEEVERYLAKGSTRELLHLESTGNNFEVLEFDKKFLKGAFVVLYLDKENNYHKETIYCGESIKCEAFGSMVGYSINMVKNRNNIWEFRANLGYNVAKEEEIVKTALFTQNEGWIEMISLRYGLNPGTDFSIEIQKDNSLPQLVLSEELLHNCTKSLCIIEDALKGYVDFPVITNGIVRIDVRHEIQSYVDFITIVRNWERSGSVNGHDFRKILSSSHPNWRNLMVKFELFEILERIDCDCFILNS